MESALILDGDPSPYHPHENSSKKPAVFINENTDIEIENELGMVNTPNRNSIVSERKSLALEETSDE